MTAAPFTLTTPDTAPTDRVRFPKAPTLDTTTRGGTTLVTLSWPATVTGPYTVPTATYSVNGGTLTYRCDRCTDGIRTEHMDVEDGRCFTCNGRADRPDVFTGTLTEAAAHYRTRSMAAVNRTRAKNRRRNAAFADRAAWIDAHPEVTAALAIHADDIAAIAADAGQTDADPNGVARRAGSIVPDLVDEFHRNGRLTEDQVTALIASVDRVRRARTAADAVTHTEGDVIQFTGTVTHTDVKRGRFGWRTLFVITGADGTVAKMWTSSTTFDGIMRGHQVTVKGRVNHIGADGYTGNPTVLLDRVKAL